MADDDNTALQDSEEGQDSLLSGSGGQQDISGSQPPPTPQTPPQGALPGGGVASTNDDDSQLPRSGAKMFLGQLLRTVLSGGLAGMSQATPIMSRGAGAANQQAQQAQQNQRANMAALDDHQMNVIKMHTAQMQQAIMAHQMIHLDDAHNQQIVDSIQKQTEFDRKEGLMEDEQDVKGEGMEAYAAAQKQITQLQPKAGMHEQYKVGITDGSDLAHLKFSVYKVNREGKITRDVFTGKDQAGKPQYESMTGKYADIDAIEQNARTKMTQDASKEQGKKYADELSSDKWSPPENKDDAQAQLDRLNEMSAFVKTHPGFGDLEQSIADRKSQVLQISQRKALPQNKGEQKIREAAAGAALKDQPASPTVDVFGQPTNPPQGGYKEANKRQDSFVNSQEYKTLLTLRGANDSFQRGLQAIDRGEFNGAQSVVDLFDAVGISSTPLAGRGFRINAVTVSEHEKARGLGQSFYQKILALKEGDIITPDQVKNYASIASDTYVDAHVRAVSDARAQGLNPDFLVPRGNGDKIDHTNARVFLKLAGGDKDKARSAATKMGWTF